MAVKHRPWLKYVHWFGYVTSSIVVLQVLFLGYLGAARWKQREDRREETRMQPGPSEDRLSRVYGGKTEVALLRKLPPLSRLSPDGFRIVATPSFGDTNFAISLRRTSAGGEGVMLLTVLSNLGGMPLPVWLGHQIRAWRSLFVRRSIAI